VPLHTNQSINQLVNHWAVVLILSITLLIYLCVVIQVHHWVVLLVFSITFALSCSMFELIIFEIIGILDTRLAYHIYLIFIHIYLIYLSDDIQTYIVFWPSMYQLQCSVLQSVLNILNNGWHESVHAKPGKNTDHLDCYTSAVGLSGCFQVNTVVDR